MRRDLSPATTIALFAVVLAVVFAVTYAIGSASGPVGGEPEHGTGHPATTETTTHPQHTGEHP
ncbi:hypothetical protein DW322_05400 [Rhodococcus rhodnii]|nr:hypothetical protein [Rhodococcus rhodnii]TXG89750.1 hypothetical protein DW322_05400 [Rhodococcus rhodnii]